MDSDHGVCMKKIAIMLSIIFLFSAVSKPILPESTLPYIERVEIEVIEDYYNFYLTVPVYLKNGLTYKEENRKIHIEIGPQKETFYHNFFIEILIATDIKNAQGKTTADFKGYLNCNLKDCDKIDEKHILYWDDVGEERADKAGEFFEKGRSLLVEDTLCQVEITLISFLCYPYLADDSFVEHESDLKCLLPLRGITFDIAVDYSPQQKEIVQSLTKVSEYTAAGDEQYQAGEWDQAQDLYEKAHALYEQIGDTLKAEKVHSKITEIEIKQHFSSAEQFFSDEEYKKALTEYEKAKTISDTLEDNQMSTEIQVMIDRCNSYLAAENNFEEGKKLFNETEDIPYYEIKIKNYKKAKSSFETAQSEYDKVGDSEKTEECGTWIQNCDAKIDKLLAQHTDSTDEPGLPWIYYVLGVVISGAAICALVLYWGLKSASTRRKPHDPESEALKTLKYRLAAGEITVEEFDELKSALDEQ